MTAVGAAPASPAIAAATRSTTVDALVIGAGQAGLAVGQLLGSSGVRFELVERNERIGDSWRERLMGNLSASVDTRVNGADSPSSLQLALENKEVQKTADDYVNGLSGIVNGKTDVIGYVFAINGKVNSADVYASSTLFKKLWPKLLKRS